MTTADVKVTEGSGKNVATYSFTEDSETKQLQRVALSKSDGTGMDFGSGTGGSGTQRILIDTAQVPTTGQAVMASSVPVTIASDQTQVPVAHDCAKVSVNGTLTAPTQAKIVASSSGATTIVAAVTSKKIRVLALKLTANAAVNVKWQSHVTPTDLTGLSYYAAAGDGEVLPFNPVGWFDTVAGEALDINLSGAVAVGGHLTYVAV
jgi:hypothetical protein